MKSIATAVSTINVPFHGDNLYLVSSNGEPYVPMKPVVEGMGLTWSSQFVKIKQRFAKGVAEIEIPSNGGVQSMTCLAFRKFAGWLHTINVGKVRPELREKVARYQEECDDVLYEYWTKGVAVNPRHKTTVNERTPLRDAVNLLVGKKGLRYDDAYNMVHQRFNIDSIDELDLEQIPLAVEYVHRIALEGEFLGKHENLSLPPTKQFTDDELISLCFMQLWMEKSQQVSKEIYPAMKQIGSTMSGILYDIANETRFTTERCKEALLREAEKLDETTYAVKRAQPMLARLRGEEWIH